jgi:hypothetical protein
MHFFATRATSCGNNNLDKKQQGVALRVFGAGLAWD